MNNSERDEALILFNAVSEVEKGNSIYYMVSYSKRGFTITKRTVTGVGDELYKYFFSEAHKPGFYNSGNSLNWRDTFTSFNMPPHGDPDTEAENLNAVFTTEEDAMEYIAHCLHLLHRDKIRPAKITDLYQCQQVVITFPGHKLHYGEIRRVTINGPLSKIELNSDTLKGSNEFLFSDFISDDSLNIFVWDTPNAK